MKIQRDEIHDQPNRLTYWIKITFLSDDDSIKSFILAAASYEYLDDFYNITNGNHIQKEHFDDWIQRIEAKWAKLGDEVFKYPIHYDAYANTTQGEANITDFLINLSS